MFSRPFKFLDVFSGFIILFTIYMIMCFYYYKTAVPFVVNISKVVVYDEPHDNKIKVIVLPQDGKIMLDNIEGNDVVEVVYEVVVKKEVYVESERFLSKISGNEERHYLLSQTNTRFFDRNILNTKRIIPILYKIPDVAEKSCEYQVYSKNLVKYVFNIVTYIRPVVLVTPSVQLCVR